jgi:preprotein translocase SecE subunit
MTNESGTMERSKLLQLYKPQQGYYTRMLTAVGSGALVLWGAAWVFDKLSIYHDLKFGLYIQAAGAILFLIAFGAMTFWLVGKKPNTVDFLISVEGEMKKVNWSSKAEVIGATKVVIVFTLLFGVLLTIVDTLFMAFFSWIGVLKGPGIGDLFRDFIGMFTKLKP